MQRAPLLHLSLLRGSFTCKRYVAPYWRAIRDRTTVLLYEDALDRAEWPRGVYLITGTDGMEPAQLACARALHANLSERPTECAVLNDPSRLKGRYDLLKALRAQGINDFDVHRVEAVPPDVRFPVFVRYERFHRANLTGLIHTRAELDDTIAQLLLKGEDARELIVVEWLDYKDEDGLYRKWGAQKVGSHVFARHLMVGSQWMMKRKYSERKSVGSEEVPYIERFPHHEVLAPVWEVGGHEWARMDYSFWKGRLQVWEINDNPELGTKWKYTHWRKKEQGVVFSNMEAALDEVSSRVASGPPMEFRVLPADVLRR